MAEFIIVPVIFGIALLLLSLGKLLGKEQEFHSCGTGADSEECATCAVPDMENAAKFKDESGLTNVAQLGNPNRKNRFIDRLDFRPDKLN